MKRYVDVRWNVHPLELTAQKQLLKKVIRRLKNGCHVICVKIKMAKLHIKSVLRGRKKLVSKLERAMVKILRKFPGHIEKSDKRTRSKNPTVSNSLL